MVFDPQEFEFDEKRAAVLALSEVLVRVQQLDRAVLGDRCLLPLAYAYREVGELVNKLVLELMPPPESG